MARETLILLLITAILALSSAQRSSENPDEQRAQQLEAISRVSSDIPKQLKALHKTVNGAHAARNAFRLVQSHDEVHAHAADPDRTQIGPKIEHMKRIAEDVKKFGNHHVGHLHSDPHLTRQVGGETLMNDERLARAHSDASLRYAERLDGSNLKHMSKKFAQAVGGRAEEAQYMTAQAASAAANAMKDLQNLRAHKDHGEHATNAEHVKKVAHKSKEMQKLRAHRRIPPDEGDE